MNGVSHLIAIELCDSGPNKWKEVAEAVGICSVRLDAIARLDDSSALVIGASRDKVPGLYRINIHDSSKNALYRTTCDKTYEYPYGLLSSPEAVCITSKSLPTRKIHGFLYMPTNNKYMAPDGNLPPLIINAHGGPTGHAGCGLSIRNQYFTSRGYACLWVNYTGSTGHGDDYRRLLYGNWGILDADDVAEYADYLVEQGRVKRGAVGITGLSAGGYNTLQTVVRHPTTFAGGFCVSGVSDLETFDAATHKLESDYTSALVLPKRADTPEDEKLKIYRERSALHHVNEIKTPLFILHGQEDTVVPLEQARSIAEAVKKSGGDVRLLEVPGEGHILGLPTSVKLWLEEEEKWWRRTLFKV
jgi:dipeptidyl aminopeptidase/acylaminoacyl peptidase